MALNLREKIAQNLFTTLKNYQAIGANYPIKKVTRDPVIIEELSREAFPVVFLETSNETRVDATLGGANLSRDGQIEYLLNVWVQGADGDTKRNELIQTIENALEVDRTRGGNARDTYISEIEILTPDDVKPYYGIRMIVVVDYSYRRGNG